MPKIFAILNVTPDSFSDGGQFTDVNKAIFFLENLKDKVFGVDIGAESTRPNAEPITSREEIARLEPILEFALETDLAVSVDTYHPKTALFAIERGVRFINDVSGLTNPEMLDLFFEFKHIRWVFMHNLTIPANKNITMSEEGEDMLKSIKHWAENVVEACQKDTQRLVFDVGIGFGKTPAQSIFLIQNVDYFKNLGVEILVGHSRKSFLHKMYNLKNPSIETLDFYTKQVSDLYLRNVDYLRLHNVD